MSIVGSANQAFLAAVEKARRALRTASAYAVAIIPEGDGFSTLILADASSGDPRILKTVKKEESVPAEDVAYTIRHLIPGVRGRVPIVLLNEKIPRPAPFTQRWVLVKPDTLEPKRVDGEVVEALFNPT